MSEAEEERPFPASPRRRQQARQSGRVVRSRELTSACLLLAAAGFGGLCGAESMRSAALWLRGELIALQMTGTAQMEFDHSAAALTERVTSAALAGLSLSLGLFAVGFAVSLALGLLQSGFVWSMEPITPTVGRLHPSAGFARLVDSFRPGAVGVSLLKLLIPGVVVGWMLLTGWDSLGNFLNASGPEIFLQSQELATSAGLRLGLAALAVGFSQFAYRHWRFELELRMTRDEVQEEQRMAGDTRRRSESRPVLPVSAREELPR